MTKGPFSVDITPDWEALLRCIRREGTPERVHFVELFLDEEVQTAICERYGLLDGTSPDAPFAEQERQIRLQRFLGYDYVLCGPEGIDMPFKRASVDDTAGLKRQGGRGYIDEHVGPITTWGEFETYPWPDPAHITTRSLEWYEANLPDDMCVIGGLTSHLLEHLMWLMGYETLCYALYDQRDLVAAIADRLLELNRVIVERLLEFERVRVIWGSDDMGFRTSTLISPKDLREFVFPGHRQAAQAAHEAGRLYFLHACGERSTIMEDLIENVGIDALHSYEDTIVDAVEVKERYGDRIAVLGGIDVDFMCRASIDQIRQRVRDTLEACIPGGGYCLGTGNSVANYIPLDHYLAMLDEGRKFRPSL
jgi:uroporphyrinogen decarboxylase